MANRYANLVGSNKIKDEYGKINAGFDAVQAEMDAKPDTSIAQVNDIEFDADDTLTIEGGTGITVTTTPGEKKLRITATGTAAPGAHGIEHNHDGSDPIPELVQVRDALAAHKADFVSVSAFGVDKNSSIIQAALDYAESVGGRDILVPSGTYDITETLEIPSNTRLIGLGEVIFRRASGSINALLINKADGLTGGYDANTNIQIENITFDGNSPTYSGDITLVAFGHCNNIRIANCIFDNCPAWHELELNACRNVYVVNCTFQNYSGATEMVQIDYAGSNSAFPWFGPYDNTACRDIYFDRCKFIGDNTLLRYAIGNHAFAPGVTTNNVHISNCYFQNIHRCIVLGDTSGMIVESNCFLNCQEAVSFRQKENDVTDWKIRNNIFRAGYIDNGQEERFIYGVDVNLTKNFSGVLIEGNTIDNCYTHGIGLTVTKDLIIKNNVIKNCGRNGIYAYGGEGIIIEGNVCYGNVRRGETGRSDRADIVVGNNDYMASKNVIVTGNNVGTYITGANVDDVLVTNNVISVSATNYGGSEAHHHNNLIAGVWTP